MTAHKHAEMIKAKANNMELVVFRKIAQSKWSVVASEFPEWNGNVYFLCLPQHKEMCLHWLNGGDIQTRREAWEDYNPKKSWSYGSIFMQNDRQLRIKPRKEKRWIFIGTNKYNEVRVGTRLFESENECKDYYLAEAGKIIEIEVEV